MIRTHRGVTLSVTLILGLLSACGGGGGGGGDATPSTTAPQSSAVVSAGAITGFGSVHVNGEHFQTGSTVFIVNGAVGTQGDLRVGQFIKVRGHRDGAGNSIADRIEFDDLVKGPVSSVAAAGLVVLGQTVHVDADTSFDDNIPGAALAGVAVGAIVEVSGTRRADGSIQATRIEAKPAGTIFEVTGPASSVDTSARRFNVLGLVVDYTSAAVQDFPSGQPVNGDIIEVKGTRLGAAGELIATRIERKRTDDGAAPGERSELEGPITRFVSATDFDVIGKRVTTNSSTVFENGVAADLAMNVKVEAEGSIDANGALVARKIQFKRQGSARVAARVDSVNASANALVVLGIDVTVNAATRLEDKGDARVTSFSLANLSPGDYVEIRGAELPANSNDVVATRLERRRIDSDVRLRGNVDVVSRPTFSILGVTVQTGASTRFGDSDSPAMSADAFFDGLAARTVSVKGTFANGVLTAREVEFEDD